MLVVCITTAKRFARSCPSSTAFTSSRLRREQKWEVWFEQDARELVTVVYSHASDFKSIVFVISIISL